MQKNTDPFFYSLPSVARDFNNSNKTINDIDKIKTYITQFISLLNVHYFYS